MKEFGHVTSTSFLLKLLTFRSDDFYSLEPSNSTRILEFDNNPFKNESNNLRQVEIPEMTRSSVESSSILRQPSESKDFVRGTSQNLMFSPGGFFKNEKSWENVEVVNLSGEEELNLLSNKKHLNKIPHGFKRGLKLSNVSSCVEPVYVGKNEKSLLSEFQVNENDLINEQEIKQRLVKKEKKNFVTLDQDFFTDSEMILEEKIEKKEKKREKKIEEVDDLLFDDISEFKIEKKSEFAVMDSMDVSNFDKLIPNMVIQV
jgi:hypothetical protein